ncbi:ATP-binding protein, partial [Patescibacteria group bacterium]|nr:ATP-binding protein [Patescibacteria group bacterium]
MEIERIKKVIVDQKEEISEFFQREKIIAREIGMEKLRKFLKYPNILVITGPRRSGKSTLATQIFKEERYGYLNFDDERLAGFSADDFSAAIQAFYDLYGENLACFIFDEIQNIAGWELFISRLRRTKKIVITGSNAKLLSGDLATHLTGRYLESILYPFSFREFLKFKKIEIKKEDFYSTKKISRTKKHLNEYLAAGGFPEIFKFGSAIVGKIYDDVITKDILLRYGIKNKNAFRELSNYVISNFAQEISYANLGHIFSIKNVHTVKNYIEYLSSSFLILMLSKFSYKLKQQFITSKKAYGIDTGLVNSVAFQFSENS